MITQSTWPPLAAGDTVVVQHRVDGWSHAVTIAEVLPDIPGAGEGIMTTTGAVYQHFAFKITTTSAGVNDQVLVDAVLDQLARELAVEIGR